jgi:hypothetical protein
MAAKSCISARLVLANPQFVGGEHRILVHTILFVQTFIGGHLAVAVRLVRLIGGGVIACADTFSLAGERYQQNQ